jgi:DNA processing protein
MGELPPWTPPSPWTFPLRNRLLAALGDAVVVAEAGPRSGALITVDAAADLGRPVFAVPGSVLGEGYMGCNRLLYDGASPVLDPDQALEDFLRLTRMVESRTCPRTPMSPWPRVGRRPRGPALRAPGGR